MLIEKEKENEDQKSELSLSFSDDSIFSNLSGLED